MSECGKKGIKNIFGTGTLSFLYWPLWRRWLPQDLRSICIFTRCAWSGNQELGPSNAKDLGLSTPNIDSIGKLLRRGGKLRGPVGHREYHMARLDASGIFFPTVILIYHLYNYPFGPIEVVWGKGFGSLNLCYRFLFMQPWLVPSWLPSTIFQLIQLYIATSRSVGAGVWSHLLLEIGKLQALQESSPG